MADLYVKRQYCEEYLVNDHWLDENYQCHGDSLAEVERHGFTYAKHIGGGWFRLVEKYNPIQQPLDWDMAAEAHDSAASLYYEPDF